MKRVNSIQGISYGSRFRVGHSNLPLGWHAEKRSDRCTVWYDVNGKQYKLSVEVQYALNGKWTVSVANLAMEENSDESSDDNKTAAETSEGEPSLTKSLTDIALMHAKHVILNTA